MKQCLVPLGTIAYARSGDKGNNANIGVIAFTKKGYTLLDDFLTPKRVQDFFISLGPTEVIRYQLPNLWALNFILKGVLAGGGSQSLRMDAQGKALGQAILEMSIALPEEMLEEIQKKAGENEKLSTP